MGRRFRIILSDLRVENLPLDADVCQKRVFDKNLVQAMAARSVAAAWSSISLQLLLLLFVLRVEWVDKFKATDGRLPIDPFFRARAKLLETIQCDDDTTSQVVVAAAHLPYFRNTTISN